MPDILTGDLHFSDRRKDEYRFGVFDWLVQQVKKHGVKKVYILGDLTEKKDKHSSRLVNRIVNGLSWLSEYADVIVLMGNHDYVESTDPFFKFVDKIPRIKFITMPTWLDMEDILLIPHTENESDWKSLAAHYRSAQIKIKYIFLHQMVEGAISESGARLNGFSTATLVALQPRRLFAGDIHRPQTVGRLTYVGAPYQVRFGDDYVPRVILLDRKDGKTTDLHFKTVQKHNLTIGGVEELPDMKKGDQVKIKVLLAREELVEWPNIKNAILKKCKVMEVDVFGIEIANKAKQRIRSGEGKTISHTASKEEVFKDFCKKEKVPSAFKEVGNLILESST